MNYWLVKSEPSAYSWDTLVKERVCTWDGVRNYQARNNLGAMKKGDRVLFYHSNEGLEIVGIAEVVKESFPDPTAADNRWISVKLSPVKKLQKPVSLQQIKSEPKLKEIPLLKQSRLSVMPIRPEEFNFILSLSKS